MPNNINPDEPENKLEGEEAITAAVAKAVEGLKTKNAELLAEKKKLQGTVTDLEVKVSSFDGIDPEKVREILKEREQSQEEEEKHKGDWDAIMERRDAKHAAELEAIRTELGGGRDKAETFAKSLLLRTELTDAMVKAGVAPHFHEAVKAMLTKEIAIEADDAEGFRAFATIDDEHVPVEKYVSIWAEGDTGKHFIAAPVNSGGGTDGRPGTGGDSKKNPFKTNNMTEMGLMIRTNPVQARKLCIEAGVAPAKFNL